MNIRIQWFSHPLSTLPPSCPTYSCLSYQNNQTVPHDTSSAKPSGCGLEPFKWWMDLFSLTEYFFYSRKLHIGMWTMWSVIGDSIWYLRYCGHHGLNLIFVTRKYFTISIFSKGNTLFRKNQKDSCWLCSHLPPNKMCNNVIYHYLIVWGYVLIITTSRNHIEFSTLSLVFWYNK